MKDILKAFIYSLIIVGISAYVLSLAIPVFASDNVFAESLTSSGNLTNTYFGQTFIPTASSTNISRISLLCPLGQATTTVDIYLCKGTNDGTDFTNTYDCTDTGNELEKIWLNNTFFCDGNVINIDLDPIKIYNGNNYYFSVVNSANKQFTYSGAGGGQYGDGVMLPSGVGDDLYFKVWYDDTWNQGNSSVDITTFPDWQGTVSVEAEYDLVVNEINYCTIGYTCRIWVNYNRESVGHTIYLTKDDSDRFDLAGAIDSEELLDGTFLQTYFSIPATTTPYTAEYCIYHEFMDGESDTIDCNIQLIWQDESTFLADYFDDFNCSTICSDIATGTDAFNFKYGVECAFRSTLCWGLIPSDQSLVKFARAVYQIENTFPFSVYTQVQNVIQDIDLQATTTPLTMNWTTFGLPYNATTTLASTTAMEDTFGSFWTTIYDIAEKVIYFFGFLYIVMEILKMSKRKE